ncbi:Rho termination factor N-terminal domain-containing protein [Jejudonia soesokkakensis]|uniref:Rho termination factor N-terminal domain-containing protein n=1 Tax=Jejudonia soesokkakensis TaxID=1323432 RepID=A0ABW2MUW9_9FLAO
MAKNHGPSIKNDEQYEALRNKGMSKEKAARIANTKDSGKKGGKATPYEERTKEQLYQKAKEIGIDGRSQMNKKQLINALRNH